MTPRSRRPVLAVSESNNTNLSTKERNEFFENSSNEEDGLKNEANEHCQTRFCSATEPINQSNQSGESLTDTFRDYLYNRSMLTTSIADDSFSSRTGDFDPSTMSEGKLSDSLMNCLDGGAPSQEMNSDYVGNNFYNCHENNESDQSSSSQQSSRIHETVL